MIWQPQLRINCDCQIYIPMQRECNVVTECHLGMSINHVRFQKDIAGYSKGIVTFVLGRTDFPDLLFYIL